MKRILSALLFTVTLFSQSYTAIQAVSPQMNLNFTVEEKEKEIEKKTSFSPLTVRLLLGALCLNLCFISASEKIQEKFKQQLHPANLLPHMAKEYFTHFFVNAMHEFGHAYAAYNLNNNDFNIHLGGNSNSLSAPLLEGHYVTLHGLDPNAGHTRFTKPITRDRELNKARYGAILAAGPLSGIAANSLLQVLNHHENISITESILANSITISQLCNLLLPIVSGKATSDAAKIYQETLSVPEKWVKIASKLALPTELLAELYLVVKQSKPNGKVAPHTITLVTITNWLLRGFIRLEL